jgi:hypothetical protein
VPGAATRDDQDDEGSVVALNGGFQSGRHWQHAAAVRDPEAVRASFSSHFGGVHSGRSHARESSIETHEGPDQQ